MKIRLIIISLILFIECGITVLSHSLADDLDIYYSLTARYSARLSFILLSIAAIWIILKHLKSIFNNKHTIDAFIGILLAFSINHVIHLYFLYKNFEVNNLMLSEKLVSPGALAYVILILIPFYFVRIKQLNKINYWVVHGFLILMIGICVFTYYTRLGRTIPLPLTPSITFFKVLIGIGLTLMIGLLWRVSMWHEQ